MQTEQTNHSNNEVNIASLRNINGINFTIREIDIIACLVAGRSYKKVSSLLNISTKTVEMHIRNIMNKLECNSKERILDFIEKSDKFQNIKDYYNQLLIKHLFKEFLNKLVPLLKQAQCNCIIINADPKKTNLDAINKLSADLHSAGITSSVITLSKKQLLERNSINFNTKEQFYIFIRSGFEENLLLNNLLPTANNTPNIYAEQNQYIEVVLDPEIAQMLANKKASNNCIDLSNPSNYYFEFFSLLKQIIPTVNITPYYTYFEKQVAQLGGIKVSTNILPKTKDCVISNADSINKNYINKHYKVWLIFLISVTILGLIAWIINSNKPPYFLKCSPQIAQIKTTNHPVRSELIVPIKSVLLQREYLLKQLQENFKAQQSNSDIASVTIVGIGGAGKTTLARQYGLEQKDIVLWELNAENEDKLINSFAELADLLAQTKAQKQELLNIQSLQFSKQKINKLLTFVKNKLKANTNWLLIYDNVDDFNVVKNYLPHDGKSWGRGRIIITTRDSNIQNSEYINSKNVIKMESLHLEEALILFSKIYFNVTLDKISKKNQEEIINFLAEIPLYPLDISLAARYLKNSTLNYQEYLDLIKLNNKNFNIALEQTAQKTSTYYNTRSSIIELSVKKILAKFPDFKEPLFLLSLVDSQQLPILLLKNSYGSIFSDQFLYELKSFSLIDLNDINLNKIISVLSIHRSTQQIILDYLLKNTNPQDNTTLINNSVTKLIRFVDTLLYAEDVNFTRFMIKHFEKLLLNTNICTLQVKETIKLKLAIMYLSSHKDNYPRITKMQSTIDFRNKYYNLPDLLQLGRLYIVLSKLDKLQELSDYILHTYHKELNDKSVVAALALNKLAEFYSEVKNYSKAKHLIKKSNLLYSKYFFNEHVGLANSFTDLGAIYYAQGKYPKALTALQKGYEIYTKHADVHWFSNCTLYLGLVHLALGNYDKTSIFFEKSTACFNKFFPKNKMNHAWINSFKGILYIELGKYKQAIEILKTCRKNFQRNFHADNLNLIRTSAYLAQAYLKNNQYNESNLIFKGVLETYIKLFGTQHIATANVLLIDAEIRLFGNKFTQAEIKLKNALKIFIDAKHPNAYKAYELLATLYQQKAKTVNKNNTAERNALRQKSLQHFDFALQIAIENFSANSAHVRRLLEKKNDLSAYKKTLILWKNL